MMLFWIGCAVLVVAVLLVLGVVLLRPRTEDVDRNAYDLLVYTDQLTELERELERGTLTADQAGAARLEIQRRILQVAGKTNTATGPVRRAAPVLAICLLVFIPVGAFGLYNHLGRPDLPGQPHAGRMAEMEAKLGQIQKLVAGVEARVQTNPDSLKDWEILARTYGAMGDVTRAKVAFAQIFRLEPKAVEPRLALAMLLMDMAERQADPVFPPEVGPLMDAVLAIEPLNLAALYYGGLAAAQSGDKAKAKALWTKTIENLPPEAGDDKKVIQEQLQELDAVGG